MKAITASLLLMDQRRARKQGAAQPRDEIAVETEVVGVLYGDSSARRRAYDTRTAPACLETGMGNNDHGRAGA